MQGRLVPPLDLREADDPEARERHCLLLSHWGEPSEVIAALAGGGAVPKTPAEPAAAKDLSARLAAETRWMREAGARYWIPDAHPGLARLGPYAPRLMFLRGDLDPTAPAVAVVGTRHPDEYGVEVARRLGFALGRAGVTVVSGGALGVDRIAHEAALDAGGRTVVVFGGGVGRPHPPSLGPLFERVVVSGSALVSEYPVHAPPSRRHFPERNRIIAALADATVVVQAGAASGALITAEWAKRLSLPLFAVPADLWYHASAGALDLLRQGARPLTHPSDLAEVPQLASLAVGPGDWPEPGHRPWGVANPWDAAATPAMPAPAPADSPLLAALRRGPADLDALVQALGRPPGRLQADLSALEIAGVARRLPGGKWALCRGGKGR